MKVTAPALISFALESAIGAELVLYSVYLLSGPRRASQAQYLFASLALCMAGLVLGNLLIGVAGFGGLDDGLLFLDLLVPPLLYLYVSHIRQDVRALVPADALHGAPAIAGLALWKTQAIDSMDLYVNLCWLAYLVAAGVMFFGRFSLYAPRARQQFLMLLLSLFVAAWLLRLVVVAEAIGGPSYRDGLPFLLVLALVFAASCVVLLTALRHPDLLTVPGSRVKYASSLDDECELDRLSARLALLFAAERPFLDPDFSLDALATRLEASPRRVSQLINARHGMNVSAYLNSQRSGVAARLLDTTSKPVKAVMFESGFRSKSIFNREFQRNFRLSPTQYRQRRSSAVD